MEKFEQMAVLLDIYGELLTQKQKNVMDEYYNYDLSLQEIAENVGISKQGVHDLMKRAEHSLLKADEKLKFLNRLSRIQSGLEGVKSMLEDLFREASKDVCTDQKHTPINRPSKLDACREEIEKLINTCLGG